MATSPLFVGSRRMDGESFVAAFGTRPRPVWTPGDDGSEIEQIHITTTDAVANEVELYRGKKLTLASAMGSGALVDGGGGSDTITRTSGSFITDGWKANQIMAVLGATTLANDFKVALSAVAALSLTFATGTVDTAEALAATSSIVLLQRLGIISVPATAGSDAAVASVSGLNATEIPALDISPNRRLRLGPDDILFAAVTTAMGAGEQLDVVCAGGDY